MAFLPFLKERTPSQILTPTQFVGNRLGIPEPKFRVGDRIKYRYICDDELDTERYLKVTTSYGTVLWMIPDVKNNRWEFCIAWGDQSPEFVEFYLSGEDQDHFELA